MKEIQILDKKFSEMIKSKAIQQRVEELAMMMNNDLRGKDVVFLGILNGAFFFAADLFKRLTIPVRISFVKLASYEGTKSSGSIKELIGWNEDIKDKTVVVVEDIIDTGATIERIMAEIVMRKAAEIKIATAFFKPGAYKGKIAIDYVGFEIPDNFVVGYGLDYGGFGRNFTSIYTLVS
jgi:hypoxanthine phosphoribosyltransferase